MKKQQPTIALIGCGRIGFLLENDPLRYKPCTHYGGASAAGLAVTHACDIDRGRLARFGTTARIPDDNLFERLPGPPGRGPPRHGHHRDLDREP